MMDWYKIPHCTIFVALLFRVCFCQNVIKIGGLFVEQNDLPEQTSKLAVDWINRNKTILPNHKLELHSRYTTTYGGFIAMKQVCSLSREPVSAIIGPFSSTTVKAASVFTTAFQVPMVSPVATDPIFEKHNFYPYLLRIFPSDQVQSLALVDLLNSFRFTTFAILTDDTDYGLNGMLQFQSLAAQRSWRVMSTQKFAAVDNPEQIKVGPQLDHIRNSGAKVVILNCLNDYGVAVLRHAHHVGLMTSGWVWVVTDGITTEETFATLVKNGSDAYLTGLIGTVPFGTPGDMYHEFQTEWSKISSESASAISRAYFDGVLAIAHGLHSMVAAGEYTPPPVVDCDKGVTIKWKEGPLLYEHILKVNASGIMQPIQFNNNSGGPLNLAFSYLRLGTEGWEKIGSWTKTEGATITNITEIKTLDRAKLMLIRDFVGDLVNKTLRVALLIEPPFVIRDDNYGVTDEDGMPVPCQYPHCYRGYSLDLLATLAKDLKFMYTVYEVADRKYGIKDPVTNRWNGLIKELLPDGEGKTKADMAIGPLTVTSEREKVIGFTKPFRDFQMTIVIGTTTEIKYNPFSFLVPFDTELWLVIVVTGISIGIYLSIADKLSPYGHHGKKVQNESEDEFEEMDINEDGTIDEWERRNWLREKEALNFHNAIFWSAASFFEQGGEFHPRAWSGRIVAAAWWFGIVIITSTYTANLAAFLTIKTPTDQIQGIQGLAEQSKTKYSMVNATSVHSYFMGHESPPYKTMWTRYQSWLAADKLDWYPTTLDGVVAAANRSLDAALLTDQPLAQYWKGQECDKIRIVDKGFGNLGYALGLPIHSMYREELSVEILKLRENGFIDKLDYEWLSKTSVCAAESQVDDTQQINLASMLGVFYVIYAGFAISMIVVVVEWITACFASIDADHPRKPKTFKEALQEKWKRLKIDFKENWFPVNLTNTHESYKYFAVPRVPKRETELSDAGKKPSMDRSARKRSSVMSNGGMIHERKLSEIAKY